MTERIRSALSHIPADNRETWVFIGMAVKAECGDAGFEIWDAWSQTADNYRPDSAKAVWHSIKAGGGISGGTLFKTARDHGWRDDGAHRKASPQEIADARRRATQRDAEDARQRTAAAAKAARKAQWILSQCAMEKHAYLDGHGFPDMLGMVWRPTENDNLLCIPMRIEGEVVGVQLIDIHGGKKFLTGQRTRGAEHVIGPRGPSVEVWCEGAATGYSIAACLAAIKRPARVHICFSAGNLERIATSGFVIADNDHSGVGKRVAEATGLPYFMPDDVGDDFNDLWKKIGTFRASQLLRGLLMR